MRLKILLQQTIFFSFQRSFQPTASSHWLDIFLTGFCHRNSGFTSLDTRFVFMYKECWDRMRAGLFHKIGNQAPDFLCMQVFWSLTALQLYFSYNIGEFFTDPGLREQGKWLLRRAKGNKRRYFLLLVTCCFETVGKFSHLFWNKWKRYSSVNWPYMFIF